MSDVSVIGCGNMGSALIEALRDAGNDVTVWNRTREKAEALARSRVTVADSVSEALEASPITLISITNYQATREVLDGRKDQLEGRTLVQLTSGEPAAARELAGKVTQAGGSYVDGAVLAYPSAVGTDSLMVLYSGNRETFESTRPLLEQLGGTAMFVGDDPGVASVLEVAAVGPAMLMAAGIWQGAKACEIEGVPFDTFAQLVQAIMPAIAEDSLRKAADPDFATDPDKIEGTVEQMADAMEHVAEYLDGLDIDPGLYEALHRLYQAGVEKGRGEHDMCCVAELHSGWVP